MLRVLCLVQADVCRVGGNARAGLQRLFAAPSNGNWLPSSLKAPGGGWWQTLCYIPHCVTRTFVSMSCGTQSTNSEWFIKLWHFSQSQRLPALAMLLHLPGILGHI